MPDQPSDQASAPALQPLAPGSSTDAILEAFLEYTEAKGIALYPAQEEAILEVFEDKNVILKTPTGSGKSLVAAAMHYKSLSQGRRSYYTCPIKALVNEKFLALCKDFGPENVGISTGDATVNQTAPIVCCTAEVLANIALRDGAEAAVDDVIMDEFHYYSDRERGVAWQIPLLTLPRARFLLISATLGDTAFFERELTRLTGAETVPVWSAERPVPLDFSYSEDGLDEVVTRLREQDRLPAYLVHFTQRAASETAQNLLSLNFLSKSEKAAIDQTLATVRFNSPFGQQVKKLLRAGIGLHHAGMLPKYRILVEKLAQQNQLKLICGTDTLGVGVNVPIRTVVFTSLAKFDGAKVKIVPVRDFHQIAGRAGRKGFDDEGFVIAQAPEHVIENRKAERKAAENPKKAKKIRKVQPREGSVNWDEKTFAKLQESPPEPLTSSFVVNHGMLLNVLGRPEDGCRALKALIRDSHDTASAKRKHRRRAMQLFRSLVEREIVEIVPPEKRQGSPVRVSIELQEDFSLNQALSLFLVDTVDRLDREDPEYARLVLALVEAVLEDPAVILRAQVAKVKDQMVAEMKAAGVAYEERMDKLQDVEHPKPYRDWIYNVFNEFASAHPWVGQDNIRPKSIGLEMFERYMSFADYTRDYGLPRAEGLLLRHLSSVYKTLTQTVPDEAWTDELEDMIAYFEQLVRGTDSSILDEWEQLRNPDYDPAHSSHEAEATAKLEAARPLDITRDRPALERLVRTAIFRVVRALAIEDYEAAAAILTELAGDNVAAASPPLGLASKQPPAAPPVQMSGEDATPTLANTPVTDKSWTPYLLEETLAPYWDTHDAIRLDPAARATHNTRFESDPLALDTLRIEHTLVDPEESNDWVLIWRLDLAESREAGEVRMRCEEMTTAT